MRLKRTSSGLGIIEVMLAVAIFGFLAISVGFTLRTVAQGQIRAREQYIASRLTKEKLEDLKKLPYFRFQPGTTIEPAVGDPAIVINDLDFIFTTTIKKVARNGLELIDAHANQDSGLIQLTLKSEWRPAKNPSAPRQKTIYSTYITNQRHFLPAQIKVHVIDASSLALLPAARIEIFQNPSWWGMTDTSGEDTINVAAGTWTIYVAHGTHESQTIPGVIVAANGVVTKNISLTPLATSGTPGNVQGTVYEQLRLLFSKVGVWWDGNPNNRWRKAIELYNPNPFPLAIAQSDPPVISYQYGVPDPSGGGPPFGSVSQTGWTSGTLTGSQLSATVNVPAGGYYLFSENTNFLPITDGTILTSELNVVFSPENYVALGVALNSASPICDSVFIKNIQESPPSAPPTGTLTLVEGNGFVDHHTYGTATRNLPVPTEVAGAPFMIYERKGVDLNSTAISMSAGGSEFDLGNGFDTQDNASDFVRSTDVEIRSSTFYHPTHTPAFPEGTVVWAHKVGDPTAVSPSFTTVRADGTFDFNLSDSTAWTLRASTATNAGAGVFTIARAPLNTYNLTPPPPFPLFTMTLLPKVAAENLPPDECLVYLVGTVVTSGGVGIPDVKADNGTINQLTDLGNPGRFFLPTIFNAADPSDPANTVTITINKDRENPAYESATKTVTLYPENIGQIVDVGPLIVRPKVQIQGYVCLSAAASTTGCPVGTGAKGVPVLAMPSDDLSGAQVFSSVDTNEQGRFILELDDKADYGLNLALEPGELLAPGTPETINVKIADFQTLRDTDGRIIQILAEKYSSPSVNIRFNLSGKFGGVEGKVLKLVNSQQVPITDGAVIIASKDPLLGTAVPDLKTANTNKMFMAMSRMDGSFTLNVPIPGTYYYYAWYGKERKGTGVPLDTNPDTTVNFQW